jgi:hypothetical protein
LALPEQVVVQVRPVDWAKAGVSASARKRQSVASSTVFIGFPPAVVVGVKNLVRSEQDVDSRVKPGHDPNFLSWSLRHPASAFAQGRWQSGCIANW